MKVLFVSSGNNGAAGILVINQAKSLKNLGVEIDHFLIIGKGLRGYLKNIPKLRKYIKSNKFEIIHAHYSLSAFVATLSGAKNLVVSLMGSDAFLNLWMKIAARLFYTFFWKVTIVKTEQMKLSLKMSKAIVLPNGVDLDIFKLIDISEARKKLHFQRNEKIILFLADPQRDEKNFPLAKQAVLLLNRKDVKLIPVYNISNKEIPTYLNAADLLLLTSKWEGSVNVIKEAMACNVPIVSTDVGDVRKNISKVSACYITSNDSNDIKDKIGKALAFNKRTNGREQLISLELDSETIAKKIITIYNKI